MCQPADFFARRGVSVRSVPYWQARGKRLQRERSVVSIPVGRYYLLLAVDRYQRGPGVAGGVRDSVR